MCQGVIQYDSYASGFSDIKLISRPNNALLL